MAAGPPFFDAAKVDEAGVGQPHVDRLGRERARRASRWTVPVTMALRQDQIERCDVEDARSCSVKTRG